MSIGKALEYLFSKEAETLHETMAGRGRVVTPTVVMNEYMVRQSGNRDPNSMAVRMLSKLQDLAVRLDKHDVVLLAGSDAPTGQK